MYSFVGFFIVLMLCDVICCSCDYELVVGTEFCMGYIGFVFQVKCDWCLWDVVEGEHMCIVRVVGKKCFVRIYDSCVVLCVFNFQKYFFSVCI